MLAVPHENSAEPAAAPSADDSLLAQKRQIRALKRVLIAKAEVRRLQSLTRTPRRVSAPLSGLRIRGLENPPALLQ